MVGGLGPIVMVYDRQTLPTSLDALLQRRRGCRTSGVGALRPQSSFTANPDAFSVRVKSWSAGAGTSIIFCFYFAQHQEAIEECDEQKRYLEGYVRITILR